MRKKMDNVAMGTRRNYSFIDKVIGHIDMGLKTIINGYSDFSRENPGDLLEEDALSKKERKLSASLMRVNHTGEVCAQALYQGQALTARDPAISEQMQKCADEEQDHLAWCKARLVELHSHTSYLNVLWYAGSLSFGLLAGLAGDRWSLGFLEETENQVDAHLAGHQTRLPLGDKKSRAIVGQMRKDEQQHAKMAKQQGAAALPFGVKRAMTIFSKVMTTVVHRI
jgi:ubiquinone biosynthesis monooxygenase Coq7